MTSGKWVVIQKPKNAKSSDKTEGRARLKETKPKALDNRDISDEEEE